MTADETPAPSLADLIELDVEPRRLWRSHELAAILAHELSVPLQLELGPLTLGAWSATSGTEMKLCSVGELLHHPRPPIELLERFKEFAKAARQDASSHLPEDVAAVLYALAIAAGFVRLGRRITSMSREQTSGFLRWAVARAWLDPSSRNLLVEAAQRLGAAADGGAGAV